MKYIVCSLVFLNLTGCSLLNNGGESTPSPIVSESGRVSQETTALSGSNALSSTGDVLSTSGGTSISSGTTQTLVSPKPPLVTATGTKTGTSGDTDPEVESITNDINKIFDDIAKEGK
ncbi:MAG: hypothetical protein PHH70_00180 [Candidatus Gracilibacteria bacterium]|nr:hypothetical protein [Candidatus Gracilibacteria bacterium]